MTKLDWNRLGPTTYVKVWEACVLGVGLEPSSMKFEDDRWGKYKAGTGPHIKSESFPNPEIEKDYEALVEALAANLLIGKHFDVSAIGDINNPRGKKYFTIPLDEFVRWATLNVEWLDLPPELVGLVKDKSNIYSAQTEARTAPVSVTTTEKSADEELASLFDGVRKQQLAAMFNTQQDATSDLDLWTGYIRQANKNELENARTSHGKYNPYKAGLWWLDKKKPKGWTLERLNKRLAKNLPERSKGNESRLTGEEYN